MKICFMGSPEFAATILNSLLVNNYSVTAVYTKLPAAQKRGLKIIRSEVHELALKYSIPVFTPINFKSPESVLEFQSSNFDLAIVAAYGLILPSSILNSPKHGCINVHGSLLPKWRGAAPIQRAIEAGDTETGITIMQMDKGLDTGDMISKAAISITNTSTTGSLYQNLATLGGSLLLTTLKQLITNGSLPKEPQNNALASYAKLLHKAEGKINFTESAATIERKIRAFNVFPSCYFNYKNETIKVHQASVIPSIPTAKSGTIIAAENSVHIATTHNILSLEVLQRAGKSRLSVQEFLKGFKFTVGEIIE